MLSGYLQSLEEPNFSIDCKLGPVWLRIQWVVSGPGLQSRAWCPEAKRAAGSQPRAQRLSYPAVLGLISVV